MCDRCHQTAYHQVGVNQLSVERHRLLAGATVKQLLHTERAQITNSSCVNASYELQCTRL